LGQLEEMCLQIYNGPKVSDLASLRETTLSLNVTGKHIEIHEFSFSLKKACEWLNMNA